MKAREMILNHPNYSHSTHGTNLIGAYASHYFNYQSGKLLLLEFPPDDPNFPVLFAFTPQLRDIKWDATPVWFQVLFNELSLDLLDKQILRISLSSPEFRWKFVNDYIRTQALVQDRQMININSFRLNETLFLFLDKLLPALNKKYDIPVRISAKPDGYHFIEID